MPQVDALISTEELAKIIDDPKVKIIDASYVGNNPEKDFEKQHIEGAVFFDIDDIADPNSKFEHMLPPAEIFAEKVGKLGISNDDAVIVYDSSGIMMAACRAWWMMRAMGHDNVAVLDGGLPKWLSEHRHIVSGRATPEPETFNATYRPELWRSLEQIQENLKNETEIVLDARPEARFKGGMLEMVSGKPAGHIPGSFNLPCGTLTNKDGTLKDVEELKDLLSASGAPTDKPYICSCGSGVTACVIALALYRLGIKDAPIYDGSWTEFSQSGTAEAQSA